MFLSASQELSWALLFPIPCHEAAICGHDHISCCHFDWDIYIALQPDKLQMVDNIHHFVLIIVDISLQYIMQCNLHTYTDTYFAETKQNVSCLFSLGQTLF